MNLSAVSYQEHRCLIKEFKKALSIQSLSMSFAPECI